MTVMNLFDAVGPLINLGYEVRCNVTHGVATSNWSNTVGFTVAATNPPASMSFNVVDNSGLIIILEDI
jgi:hypothetical protein